MSLLKSVDTAGHSRMMLFTLMMIGLINRLSISGLGPLIIDIRHRLGLSAAAAGFINTLLVLMFALTAYLTGRSTFRISVKHLITACSLFHLTGALLRVVGGALGLYVGTILIGIGIGVMNVLLPAFIAEHFSNRIGFAMGAYSVALSASSALAVAVAVPLKEAGGSYKTPLFIFAIVILPSIILWIRQPDTSKITSEAVTSKTKVESDTSKTKVETDSSAKSSGKVALRRYALLGAFMGLQGMLFFSFMLWLPSILIAQHRDSSDASLLLMLTQIASLPTSMTCGTLAQRSERKWQLALFGSTFFLSGLLLILIANGNPLMHLLGVLILGLGNGMVFAMPLALISLSGRNKEETRFISAMVQAIGYVIAATGPVLLGWLYDLTENWSVPIAAMIAGSMLMLIAGIAAARQVDLMEK